MTIVQFADAYALLDWEELIVEMSRNIVGSYWHSWMLHMSSDNEIWIQTIW